VATDVAAEKATELPKLGRPRMKLNAHTSQTGVKAKANAKKERSQRFCCPQFERENVNGRTGANWRTPPRVHFVQELGAWDRTVPAKGVHHPRIRCHRKGPIHGATTRNQHEHRWIRRWARPYPQKSIAPMMITYQKSSSPTCQPSQKMSLTIMTIVPFSPTVSKKICVTG
jgi:hypothetical protein